MNIYLHCQMVYMFTKFKNPCLKSAKGLTFTCKNNSEQDNLKSQSTVRNPLRVGDESTLQVFLEVFILNPCKLYSLQVSGLTQSNSMQF